MYLLEQFAESFGHLQIMS